MTMEENPSDSLCYTRLKYMPALAVKTFARKRYARLDTQARFSYKTPVYFPRRGTELHTTGLCGIVRTHISALS